MLFRVEANESCDRCNLHDLGGSTLATKI